MLPQGTSLLLDPKSLASATTSVHNSHNFGRSWRFTRVVPKTGTLSPSVLCCAAAMRAIPRRQPRAPIVIEATRPTPRNARIIAVGLKLPGAVSLPLSVPMLDEGVSEADAEVGNMVRQIIRLILRKGGRKGTNGHFRHLCKKVRERYL